MSVCVACPRACGVDRKENIGFCGVGEEILVARVGLHRWEEPCISGTDSSRGSGTVFFGGCNLRCVFCQNYELSHSAKGKIYTSDALEAAMLSLVDAGAYNINLVTPSHYVPYILPVLRRIKGRIGVPIVYNCGGYESVETLRMLEGIVDVYLPDFKYFSPEISAKYSRAADYFTVACAALGEMYRQVGAARFGADTMIEKGMVVRHLVLPGNRKDSIQVLRALAELLPVGDIKLSLMRQYTPDFALGCEYTELHRRLTEFEYTSVLRVAEELGFDGYFQGKDSADKKFTPDFEG